MFNQDVTLAPGTEAFSSHLLEIIIMLLGAAILGYIIGRLFTKSYKKEYFDLEEVHAKCTEIENNLRETISKLNAKIALLEKDIVSYKQSIADLTSQKVQPTTPALDFALAQHVFGTAVKMDDLKIVEGIGPKIEELFHQAGITKWAQLANADPKDLKSILDRGGPNFLVHDPTTWPQQAKLAANGHWQELKDLQDKLIGGK